MTSRWTMFGLWAIAGAAATFGVLDITSIGLFLLPASLVVIFIIVAGSRAPLFPAVLGSVQGAAAIFFWGAFISRGMARCRPGVPLTVMLSEGSVTTGCVKIDSDTWFVRGVGAALMGVALYLIAAKLVASSQDG
jgi:hypothetical protein